jgi:hypothetical protein
MTTLPDTSERQRLIETVKSPLGFFCLVILVTEAIFVGLALASAGADRTFMLYAATGILVLLILVVAGISAWRPEALWGKRFQSLDESLARGLGEEIYMALEHHLGDRDRSAIYDLLCRSIASSPHAQAKATRKFCETLIETIARRAELSRNGRAAQLQTRMQRSGRPKR